MASGARNSLQEESRLLWEIEAWRGLAAWLVVYAHFWSGVSGSPAFMRFAFTGVDLFFVLSGFIFAPYVFGKPVQLGPFWTRRFFRIYPAYLLALALYVGLKLAAGERLLYVGEHLTFTYLQNLQMAFYYNPAFWSLPSEVEFYVVLPLVGWWCRGSGLRVALVAMLALVARISLGVFSDRVGPNSAFIWMHHLAGMGVEFFLGTGAWRLAGSRFFVRRVRWAVLALAMGAWLGMACWFGYAGDAGVDATWARGQLGWLAAVCFAGMVAATQPGRNALPSRCWLFAAVWAGRLSYGVYLFHMAALAVAVWLLPHAPLFATGLAVCITLALAWVSFMAWEEPLRRRGRGWASACVR